MMSIPLNTIRRYLLTIVFNSLVNIANRHKFLSYIYGDSNILRTKPITFASNKNLMDIVLQDKNNRRVDSYFALLNSHLNAIFQDVLTVLKNHLFQKNK